MMRELKVKKEKKVRGKKNEVAAEIPMMRELKGTSSCFCHIVLGAVAAEIPMMRELKGPWISPFPEFNATSLRTPSASF